MGLLNLLLLIVGVLLIAYGIYTIVRARAAFPGVVEIVVGLLVLAFGGFLHV